MPTRLYSIKASSAFFFVSRSLCDVNGGKKLVLMYTNRFAFIFYGETSKSGIPSPCQCF